MSLNDLFNQVIPMSPCTEHQTTGHCVTNGGAHYLDCTSAGKPTPATC